MPEPTEQPSEAANRATRYAELESQTSALRETLEELSQASAAVQAGLRQRAADSKVRYERAKRWWAVNALVLALCVVMTTRTADVFRGLWLMLALTSAISYGALFATLTVLREQGKKAELFAEAAEPAERQALLIRFNDAVGTYPHLWPATVPIIVALVAASALVAVELLKLIVS